MRILHVYPTITRPLGWAPDEVKGLCGGQVRRGNDVDLVTTNFALGGTVLDVPTDTSVNIAGVKVRYFPVDAWLRALVPDRYSNFCYSSALGRHLTHSVRSYDVVHIHTMWSYVTIMAARSCRKSRVPHIVSVMGGLDPIRSALKKKAFFGLFHQRDLEHASAVHFLSDGELVTARAFHFDGRSVVIPFGIDVAKYEPSVRRGRFRNAHPDLLDAKLVVYLGRLSATKGLDLLVRAFARLSRGNQVVRLLLVGADYENYAAHLRDIARAEGIVERVIFTGELPEEDKMDALVDSDAFVLPSYSEAFGVALAEALCSRLPAVVTDTLGLAPLLSERNAALVVPSDIISLSSGIDRILHDPALAKTLTDNGYSMASDLWDWPKVVKETLTLYDSVMSTSVPREAGITS
jgi:glycosyltransferase involved in cell wall biosynthesis